jgi:hypothetical protein
MSWKYVGSLLVAAGVFVCCFFVLKFWFGLQSPAAAIGAAISAAGSFFGSVLGLVKTTLEIEKLRHENRKLKRDEAESSRIVKSPSMGEIEKFVPRSFVAETREEHLPPERRT